MDGRREVEMNNVTRTITRFQVEALTVNEDGTGVETVASCECLATTMTKHLARAELADAAGCSLPRGVLVKWKPLETTTYAMPLEKFVENSIVIKKESID